MAFSGKKANKLWLYKVNVFLSGTLIDWQVDEQRDRSTLKRLYQRIEVQYHPSLYCTDDWKTYPSFIPKDKHVTGKAGTYKC